MLIYLHDESVKIFAWQRTHTPRVTSATVLLDLIPEHCIVRDDAALFEAGEHLSEPSDSFCHLATRARQIVELIHLDPPQRLREICALCRRLQLDLNRRVLSVELLEPLRLVSEHEASLLKLRLSDQEESAIHQLSMRLAFSSCA